MSDSYPDALASVIPALASVLRTRHSEALASRPDLIDRTILEFLREVGLELARSMFELAGQAAVESARSKAGARGKKLVVERNPSITFRSVFGPITVSSPYLRETGPKPAPVPADTPFLGDERLESARPVNDALRVRGGGVTVHLQRVLADFGLDSSFETAASKLKEHYGLVIHRTLVRRTTLRHGELAEWAAQSSHGSSCHGDEPGPPVLAEMDGSCVRTGEIVPREPGMVTPKRRLNARKRITTWRDLRLAFVRHLDGENAVFVGGILPLDEVADRLRNEAVGLGWTTETVTVRVSDGGHGVREALDRVFPRGVHILDRPHLHHHLFETATAMALPDDQVRTTVLAWSQMLARGEVEVVLRALAAYEGPGKDRVKQFAGYLERFRDAVTYDEFQRLGYPIGSGEIESAHKGHVQARLKLPGTWWTPRNVNRLLALRLCRHNGRWEEHWKAAA